MALGEGCLGFLCPAGAQRFNPISANLIKASAGECILSPGQKPWWGVQVLIFGLAS
jgi:hypothetical protein